MADAVPPREMSNYTYEQQALRKADGIHAAWTHTGSSGQWKVPRSAHQQRPHLAHTTAAKASKTLGLLRRNLSENTKDVKKATYTALVRPTLEYASPV